MNGYISIESLYSIYQKHPFVITDSRAIQPGCLFFALKGARFDGNQFAQQALRNGAVYAIVDNPGIVESDRFLLVEDVLSSLQQLATHHRRQFHIPVVGITGSNGKTTTKELISAVLSLQYQTHFTQGNYNNHIGVPLTLLAMPANTEVAVIEMGANHQGEIDFLSRIAEPTHGLITNIGKAHLEGFGGIEGVKKGKSELYRFLIEAKGVAIINRDEPFLEELASGVLKKIFYKQEDQPDPKRPDFEIKLLEDQPFLRVGFLNNGELLEAQSHLSGIYNLGNIMSAIAIGRYFKVSGAKIKQAIESYIPQNNRSQWIEAKGYKILLDAYNANPSSMRVALSNLAIAQSKRKVAILGDMLELGEYADQEHLAMIEHAKALGLNEIILVGPQFKRVISSNKVLHFDEVNNLSEWFKGQSWDESTILIKGSRGIKLEKVVEEVEHS